MRRISCIVFCLLAMLFCATTALAEIPPLIPVQGVLADSDGHVLDGSYDLTFKIYDSSAGTSALWTELLEDVAVYQGFFTVYLGSETALSIETLTSASELWLSMTVADQEMSRVRLGSVFFALEAQVCRQLGDLEEGDVQPMLGEACETGEFLRGWDDDLGQPYCDGPDWSDLSGIPVGFSDGVDDTGSMRVHAPSSTTITSIDTTGDVGTWTSITVGTDGLAVISYLDYTNNYLKVAHCSDLACTSATATSVDTSGSVGGYTSITIGSDGFPFVSYYDSGGTALKVAHCTDVACSGTVELRTLDSSDDVGKYSSVTIGSDGFPVISYFNDTDDNLKVAHCTSVACTVVNINTVDETDEVGEWSSISLGADGLPIISYYDATNTSLKVAHCGNLTCSSSTITTVDNTSSTLGQGSHTSITIGGDGFPIISYFENVADLRVGLVAHCTNVSCSTTADLNKFGTGQFYGEYSSITIGTDGLPVVSYYNYDSEDLLVAHCTDAACSGNTSLSVDTSGSVGNYTSMTIGADGFPIISYHAAGDLKVAHCSNAFCAPYFRRR